MTFPWNLSPTVTMPRISLALTWLLWCEKLPSSHCKKFCHQARCQRILKKQFKPVLFPRGILTRHFCKFLVLCQKSTTVLSLTARSEDLNLLESELDKSFFKQRLFSKFFVELIMNLYTLLMIFDSVLRRILDLEH